MVVDDVILMPAQRLKYLRQWHEWQRSAFGPVAAYFWPHVPQPDDEQKEPKVTVADDGTIVSAEPEQPVDKTRETWEAWNRKEEERRRRGC